MASFAPGPDSGMLTPVSITAPLNVTVSLRRNAPTEPCPVLIFPEIIEFPLAATPTASVPVTFTAKSILELAALIDKCRLYIGASTGPSHIAGNLGKKCVCIYPAYKFLSHTRWGLYGNDANTTYIVPDADNAEQDYKSKVFSNITDDIINEAAEKALEKLYGGA